MASPTFYPSSISGEARSRSCAACKQMRRRCTADCIFAPYFSAAEPQKFSNVHQIFGASNVAKILSGLPVWSRSDAVSSLAYEAEARVRNPSCGCVHEIFRKQERIMEIQLEIDTLMRNINALEAKGVRVPFYYANR